ncbi:hypothetical protein [Streptomyces rubellomurinus]|uniref:Lipoprotein n=1 Tax=Streptomyces rubellomurinus (strain ATCC 31215) TaxID=359131 RepID=A0A0F2TPJ7_STRR3|nr:hypothetical protein [Streptomyces rubellomurinus]KJS63642.1 hypothetical protein VM95_01935 [Streptomyces rubellomurinus]
MDLETMPRRRRRAVALAGLALAAVVTVAGCNGDGKSSDSASSSASATSASASASPQAPTASGSPSAGATGQPAQPPTGFTPTPASPPPGQPAPGATPPVNGIAPGEPNPNGTGGAPARPAVGYRMDGSNKLTVYFFGGVCTKYALKVDESPQGRVNVQVVPGPPTTQPGQVCNALAKRQSVSADLRAPLAGRTVTDQPSGQDVPLEGDPHAGPDPVGPDGAAQ